MRLFAQEFTERDLIAFHLRELKGYRELSLRRALKRDPALAAESEAVASLLRAFKVSPTPPIDDAVRSRNWDAVRPTLTTRIQRAPQSSRWRTPALAALGLAAVGSVMFVLSTHHSVRVPSQAEINNQSRVSSGIPAFAPNQLVANVEGPRADAQGSTLVPRQLLPPRNPVRLLPLAVQTDEAIEFLPLAMSDTTPVLDFPNQIRLPSPPAVPSRALQSQPQGKVRKPHTTDLMLGVGGELTAARSTGTISSNGVPGSSGFSSQGATNAIVAIAALHQQFRPALGYRISASYSRPDFNYARSTVNGGGAGEIDTRIYELAGTFVLQGPHRGRLSTSADAGAALLAFLPTNPDQPLSYVYRGAAVLGANADLRISKHWGLRAAYRAQLYKGPDFRYSGGVIPVSTKATLSNEPFVGLTYTFGSRGKD